MIEPVHLQGVKLLPVSIEDALREIIKYSFVRLILLVIYIVCCVTYQWDHSNIMLG